jgi:hypothetical protein
MAKKRQPIDDLIDALVLMRCLNLDPGAFFST